MQKSPPKRHHFSSRSPPSRGPGATWTAHDSIKMTTADEELFTPRRHAMIWFFLCPLILWQLGYVGVHVAEFELTRFIAREPSITRRVLCGTSAALLAIACMLAMRSLRSRVLTRRVVASLAVCTTLIVGMGFVGTLAARAHVAQAPWWVHEEIRVWLGSSVWQYDLHPALRYGPTWLAFAMWAIGLLARGDSRARAGFLVVAWMVAIATFALQWPMIPIQDAG